MSPSGTNRRRRADPELGRKRLRDYGDAKRVTAVGDVVARALGEAFAIGDDTRDAQGRRFEVGCDGEPVEIVVRAVHRAPHERQEDR